MGELPLNVCIRGMLFKLLAFSRPSLLRRCAVCNIFTLQSFTSTHHDGPTEWNRSARRCQYISISILVNREKIEMATDNITFKCTDKGERGDGRREGRQADTDADRRSRSSKCLHLLCHKKKQKLWIQTRQIWKICSILFHPIPSIWVLRLSLLF